MALGTIKNVTESDHAKVELLLNIKIPKANPFRNEMNNLK